MRMQVARRKEAERALRESEELYKDFVEGTADLVTQVGEWGLHVCERDGKNGLWPSAQ